MKDLYSYIIENEQIDEGLFKSAMGFAYIKHMDSNYLLEGLLNMYEYIIGKGDIKLFYQDFPTKERPFWTNVYKLYESKIWSIFDAQKPDVDTTNDEDDIVDMQDKMSDLQQDLHDRQQSSDDPRTYRKIERQIRDLQRKIDRTQAGVSKKQEDSVGECFSNENELIDVTPEFRRQLRNIIKDSSNSQDDLNANNVQKIMLINDPQFDKRYIFTINKIQGMFRRLFKAVDTKMLEAMFKKIADGE